MIPFQPGGRRFQCVSEHHLPRQESVVPLLCDILGEALRARLWHIRPGPVGGGRLRGVRGPGGSPNVGQKALRRLSAPVLVEKPGMQPLASSFILDAHGKPDFNLEWERKDG